MSKSLTIDFVHRYEWGTKDNRYSSRPYTALGLVGTSGALIPVWSLVDTGADIVQLDIRLGIRAGYDPRNAPVVATKLANGARSTFHLVQKVVLEVEGNQICGPVLFADNAPNILGRQAILASIELGIDVDGWLYKYK